MENDKEKIRYFSMFTGIGGFELGIGDKGKCIGFSEIDRFCVQLLKSKFPDIKNYGDARKINPRELPDFDILCGGFPCQAFSIAGKRRGFQDTRGTLFFEIARILEVKRPKIVFLENVKGILNHDKGKTLSVIFQSLAELGYDVQWMVLNSRFFGVPQNRERIFIIGNLRTESRPEILPIGESVTETVYREELPRLRKIFELSGDTPSGISRQTDRVWSINGISPTLTSQLGELTIPKIEVKVRILTDEQNKIRRLTPIECERLQGFPDNWTEGFNDNQRYKMLGNAVTVNVIKSISERIL